MNIIDLYDKFDNLYFVGGIVRDELLGKESPDVDITVVGNAVEFCQNLNEGEIVQINPDFGTVRMKFGKDFYDFASTRKETYPQKGGLPKVVEIGCSLEDDVLRRDFTVNSIAKNTKTGEMVDFTGGIKDLENKQLRILHDESFVDDPTRIIRGLKFAVRFGFELEEHTKFLQDKYLQNVDYNMSFKRVKDELVSTFDLNSNSNLAYEKFISEKIYKLITEKNVEFVDYDIEGLINRYKTEVKNVWLVYVALVGAEKLDLTKQEKKIIDDFQKLIGAEFENDFELSKAFEKSELEAILLYEIIKQNGKAFDYLDKWRFVKLEITGEDLKKMGIEPSVQYSEIFEAVKKEKFINPEMTKEDEMKFITTFVTVM